MKYQNILETIGNTDHIRLNRIFPGNNEVWLKLERQNPGGSIKDRIALDMIEDAERKGLLKSGGVIIEPTSGNTGIGLAMVGAVKGYKVILVMPESMSAERRKLMSAYGAEVELTPKEGGMKGAIERAESLLKKIPGSWMPSQFDNPVNIETHIRKTAEEIKSDFPDGIDYFIAAAGTGGHLSGCAFALKKAYPNMKVIAVEPCDSAVISGKESGTHKIQGIGAGFIPDNLKMNLIDDVICVEYKDAVTYSALCAQKEGILGGISSGAVLAAASLIAQKSDNAVIFLFNYDTGERYLSVPEMF